MFDNTSMSATVVVTTKNDMNDKAELCTVLLTNVPREELLEILYALSKNGYSDDIFKLLEDAAKKAGLPVT